MCIRIRVYKFINGLIVEITKYEWTLKQCIRTLIHFKPGVPNVGDFRGSPKSKIQRGIGSIFKIISAKSSLGPPLRFFLQISMSRG